VNAVKATCSYVGPVAETLGNGRPVAPGETVAGVDTDDPHNALLLEQGRLIRLEDEPNPKSRRKPAKSEEASS
jgi:hypothetical protein